MRSHLLVLACPAEPRSTSIARYALAVSAGPCASVANLPAAASTSPAGHAAETITFDQDRDWRMHFVEERQVEIAAELADKNLIDARCASLPRRKAKAKDDNFAAIPTADHDRLFSERFDEIEANRGGAIDRNAWHDKPRVVDARSLPAPSGQRQAKDDTAGRPIISRQDQVEGALRVSGAAGLTIRRRSLRIGVAAPATGGMAGGAGHG